jgi:CheY-like chemotaxis protein
VYLFEAMFPVSRDADDRPALQTESLKYERGHIMRYLIVDDYVPFLDAASGLLGDHGTAVVGVATCGAEALSRAEELRPEVILVDINLGAESGFDVVEQLHQDARSAPVILISTHAEQDFADMIAASPAVGFLCKSALSPAAVRDLLSGRDDDDRAGGAQRAS